MAPPGPLHLVEADRRGSGYLFLAVAVVHMVLISAQVTTKRGTPVLQAVTFGLVSEVQRGGAGAVHGVMDIWHGYVDLRGIRQQNEDLARELAATRIHLQQERALAQETRGLQQLLDLREAAAIETAAADVIAAAPTPDFRTVTIGKGRSSGLRPDMAVLAPAGVVGRVIVPSARTAKVQLLVDRNAAAGALVERSRAQGVVTGAGDDQLRLEYLERQCGHPGRRQARHLRDRRHLPEGIRDRLDPEGRACRRRLWNDSGTTGRGFRQSRARPGRPDAAGGRGG